MSTRFFQRSFLALAAWAFGLLAPADAQSASAAQGASAEAALQGADVVVLMDVSQSVLPWFKDAVDYVVGPVARDFLRLGDTFHLLSFGSSAQVEIAQRVTSEADLRSILGRLYLLYPVSRSTDLLGSLTYLEQYLADLPVSAPKYVVVVTDGVNDPGAGSPNAALTAEQSSAAFKAEAERIRRNGWRVRIVKLPFSAERAASEAASGGRPLPAATGAGSTGSSPAGASDPGAADPGAALLEELGGALGTEVTSFTEADKENLARMSLALPIAIFPADLGKRGWSFDLPLRFRNPTAEEARLELESVLVDGAEALREKAFIRLAPGAEGSLAAPLTLPSAMGTGSRELSIELRFADGARTAPTRALVKIVLAPNPLALLFRSAGKLLLVGLAVLLAMGALVLAAILLHRAPKRSAAPVVKAVRGSQDEAKGRPSSAPVPSSSPADRSGHLPPPAASGKGPTPSPGRGAASPVSPEGSASASSAASPAAGQPLTVSGSARKPQAADNSWSSAPSPLPAAGASGSAASASRVARPAARPSYTAGIARPGSITLELRLPEQNSHVGMRNIHSLQAGSMKTIGGGRSDFLIFLVPMPAHCAELHFDGERLVFVPLRPELFPGLEGPRELSPGDSVAMRSPKGYALSLGFHPYMAPADRINRLLHCIEAPGLFSFDLD